MFYRLFRGAASLALHLFFRLEAPVDPHGGLSLEGPVMYVGNHPNGLVDPGIVFVLSKRQVTFLAKEPLFRLPLLGAVLRGLGALPVFRKQDGDGDTSKNEGTLSAATNALVAGHAITIFPEGKSHSEPQLSALKTGAARIVLAAAEQGAPVHLVPVGITYEAKHLFHSAVHVEVGAPLAVEKGVEPRALTQAIADALRAVTLNLAARDELPLLKTAEALFALSSDGKVGAPERLKAFARGVQVLRDEQPARLEALKAGLAQFNGRLALLRVSPDDLSSRYQPLTVAWFVVRNLLWLVSLPVAALGLVTFVVPYYLPLLAVKAAKPEEDVESTVKVLTSMLVAPLWWALLTGLAWWSAGPLAGLAAFVATPVLALFTRLFVERRLSALHDARTFFVLLSRRRLKARLLEEGRELSSEIEALVSELSARV